MKFSPDWINELGKLNVSANEAAELLNAKACETEVGDDGNLDADILPNRPDLLSHIGIARELAALTNHRFTEPGADISFGSDGTVSVTIDDAAACPRYSGLVIRGISVGPSPDWLSSRLESLGIGSVNNVVDAVNLVMLEIGQPMHAFDLAKLQGGIRVRYAKKGERMVALDDARTEYELDPATLVIADDSGPVAIAGIKGGAETAVSDQTHDVFLESAVFASSVVRASTTRLNLRTDASVRFSYGVSPYLPPIALARAAQILTDVAGGEAEPVGVDAYPHPWHPRQLMLSSDYVRGLLGEEIQTNDIVSILSSLGFAVSGNEGKLEVSVPEWRLDVERQEDLIEEVGRVYGYENIQGKPPVVQAYDERTWVKEDEDVPWVEYGFIRERHSIARALASYGYAEVYNYAFISDALKHAFGLVTLREPAKPQSEEYRYLRPSLLPRLTENIRDNLRFSSRVRIFETGHRFTGDGRESSRLAMALGARLPAGKAGKGGDELFYELKGVFDHLAESFGMTDLVYGDAAPFEFATLAEWCGPGRVAEVKSTDGTALGVIGVLKPEIAMQLKVKGVVAVAEFDLKTLIRHAQAEREFAPLPKYPSVQRDISILVNDEVRVRQILSTIQNADSSGLVQDVDVMDIFVPTGDEKLAPEYSRHEYGKSIAVRVVYRSDERTLTDEEVTVAEDTIKRALTDELSAVIR